MKLKSLSVTLCPLLLLAPNLQAQPAKAVEAKQGMVVTVSPPASDAGVEILKKGGNAVDAAVATAFALAVTHPAAGNIGGGGFMLVHPPKGDPTVFEYRETAPGKASKDMYKLNESHLTHRTVGVPGTVRGLELAHKRFGKLPWKDVVQPAVKLAADGFKIDAYLAKSLNGITTQSAKTHPELTRVYGKDGKWSAGDMLVLADLARTLRLIADQGADAFYKGAIADLIVKEMEAGGGIITRDDLATYEAKERKPIHGTYRGFDVYGPPPPSSGGICLVEMLNMLEHFDLKKQGRWSKETLHVMSEVMRRAFCDRARWLGDPGFTKIPDHLTKKEYAAELVKKIDLTKATPSADLAKDIPLGKEGDSTTHFSVIDKDGLAVSNTYTLQESYGSRIVVKGAGFLLNNEMTDFNWRTDGKYDPKGGIGSAPNLIAPGKRMLSSQTPTIIARDGKLLLVTGTPGGRTIINTVLCIVVNVLDFDMDIQAAVDAPRIHHQWFPDEIRYEKALNAEAVKQLQAMGHTLKTTGSQGDAHSIRIDPKTGVYQGAADRRIAGKAAGY
jgi:gamma-glutamyltranspeptidase/glutathione hydrolase